MGSDSYVDLFCISIVTMMLNLFHVLIDCTFSLENVNLNSFQIFFPIELIIN